MPTCVRVVIATALAACSSATPGERERALARIPAQAQMILAADGAALAKPELKRVADSLTSHVPPGLGCVAEAALTSDAIAVGVTPEVGATIVLVTRVHPDRCPALSRIGDRIYTATIGAGTPIDNRAHSVLASPTWDRARPYLLREPLALAAELPDLRLVAVAQPDPLDAWLVVDASDTQTVRRAITRMLDSWKNPRTVELAGKLTLTGVGTQISVKAEGLTSNDLITIVGDTLERFETPPPAPSVGSLFHCPQQPGNGVVSCHDGTQYKVSSVQILVKELATIESAPVIAGGDIIGIRLLGEPRRLLQRDDVILGIDSHRITEAKLLADLAPTLEGKVSIAVRREGVDAVLELSE